MESLLLKPHAAVKVGRHVYSRTSFERDFLLKHVLMSISRVDLNFKMRTRLKKSCLLDKMLGFEADIKKRKTLFAN